MWPESVACATMRFGSTAKVLAVCKLKYYRISECVLQVDVSWESAVACIKSAVESGLDAITTPLPLLYIKDFLLLCCSTLGACANLPPPANTAPCHCNSTLSTEKSCEYQHIACTGATLSNNQCVAHFPATLEQPRAHVSSCQDSCLYRCLLSMPVRDCFGHQDS